MGRERIWLWVFRVVSWYIYVLLLLDYGGMFVVYVVIVR